MSVDAVQSSNFVNGYRILSIRRQYDECPLSSSLAIVKRVSILRKMKNEIQARGDVNVYYIIRYSLNGLVISFVRGEIYEAINPLRNLKKFLTSAVDKERNTRFSLRIIVSIRRGPWDKTNSSADAKSNVV
ncbi:hypothetical protein Tcan_10893 [Toxocara canis]|uniref:Uncharacterized protein n=1 Tax=Toxocara canis TaxID=6265 RepID=A0A0B2VSC7_TOXCA|nr:hypothetical protein Tcan_10893 [Toxocara canis]